MDNFAQLLKIAVSTNVYYGPILGLHQWAPTTLLPDGQAVVTALPGHPETITYWGLVDDVYAQLTPYEAAMRTIAVSELTGWNISPGQMYARTVEILNMTPPVELVGVCEVP